MDPNIEQLTEERDTYEAQRDHYRDTAPTCKPNSPLVKNN
jgi:hypothetical protein